MDGVSDAQNIIKIGVTITEGDVFETEDLPEDDQQLISDFINVSARETHKNDCIESSRIDATEAFKAFADKSLDSQYVDFSDSIAISKVGYPMMKAEGIKKETLEEKYSRLLQSVNELAKEINIVNENGTGRGSHLSVMERLDFLEKELFSVGKEEHFVANDPQKFYQKKLLNDLDLFISSPPVPLSSAQPSAVSPPIGNVIKYQIYCAPRDNLHAEDAVIGDLEQRIQRCEDIIGLDSGFFTGDAPNKTLLGALSLVAAKFALLDLTQLTHFESSLLAIHQKQIQASTKSEASDIADKVDKVSNVYEVVKKADPMMEKLPELSERLKSMLEMHQSATQFAQTLAHLDLSQKQIIEHLQGHMDHLKQIQALLGPQMALFEANCKTLEELAV